MELLAIFVALQIADIYTTHTVLKQGGREMNPILADLFRRFGHLPVLVVLKAAAVAVVWWIGRHEMVIVSDALHFPTWWIIAAFCVGYAWVVYHNIGQIKHG